MATNATWTIRQGDTKPAQRAVIYMDTEPLDLDGATVVWRMRLVGADGAYIETECAIIDAAAGLIEYQPKVGDTDVPGTYQGVLVVTFDDNTQATIPTKATYLPLQVTANDLIPPAGP